MGKDMKWIKWFLWIILVLFITGLIALPILTLCGFGTLQNFSFVASWLGATLGALAGIGSLVFLYRNLIQQKKLNNDQKEVNDKQENVNEAMINIYRQNQAYQMVERFDSRFDKFEAIIYDKPAGNDEFESISVLLENFWNVAKRDKSKSINEILSGYFHNPTITDQAFLDSDALSEFADDRHANRVSALLSRLRSLEDEISSKDSEASQFVKTELNSIPRYLYSLAAYIFGWQSEHCPNSRESLAIWSNRHGNQGVLAKMEVPILKVYTKELDNDFEDSRSQFPQRSIFFKSFSIEKITVCKISVYEEDGDIHSFRSEINVLVGDSAIEVTIEQVLGMEKVNNFYNAVFNLGSGILEFDLKYLDKKDWKYRIAFEAKKEGTVSISFNLVPINEKSDDE
jgi:hypothetical protein